MNTCKHCGQAGRFYYDEPTGYIEWSEWAEKKSRTHNQLPCPNCGWFTVWRRK